VALEATGNTWAIAALLASRAVALRVFAGQAAQDLDRRPVPV
jgi:hypothetical protein